ncbi:MAG: prepilin-type N-terminal cleavage/methylation domain-containing protein [Gammaproteobacteria bacterium]|nr:prepilin-type N-terminal cleavage/methylation domain-containing protein [Gammaproteobacteria bacterium]
MKTLSRSENGFTLVELMIATMIGIFIIGGAGKVYMDSKTTFLTRDTVAAATESARFAVQDLRRTLVMAGRGITEDLDHAAAYATTDNLRRTFPVVSADGSDASVVKGVVDKDKNGSSAIAIRYADGPAPCGTTGTIAGTNTTVRFYVNDNSELVCEVVTSATSVVKLSQPLVSGVAQMWALYGVDTNADGYANAYWTASQVDDRGTVPTSRWPNVVSMRIGMVVNSGNVQLPRASRLAATEKLSLLGSDYTVPSKDNALFHKTVSTTLLLRNLHAAIQRQ